MTNTGSTILASTIEAHRRDLARLASPRRAQARRHLLSGRRGL